MNYMRGMTPQEVAEEIRRSEWVVKQGYVDAQDVDAPTDDLQRRRQATIKREADGDILFA